MQIVRIEAATVRAELVKPYVAAMDKQGLAEVRCVVLRLTTEDGLCGLGESDPFPAFTYESPETVMQMIRQYLGPAVLGLDPGNLVGLHLKLDSARAAGKYSGTLTVVVNHF